MLFHEHCSHVRFVSGAGRNSTNELLSQKCPQAASLVDEEQGKLWEGRRRMNDGVETASDIES